MASAVKFLDVRKSFGLKSVLNGLDLDVPAGEVFALVGANGAGKSTSIKAMLDFTGIDGGSIQVFGTDHTLPTARARLAFLPERFQPPYYLTGREYLRSLARLYAEPYSEHAVVEWCHALDLDPGVLPLPVRTYSKGMSQKLGLLGAFASGRELLILDEPLSGLDPKARILVKQELARLHSDGRSIFFSSHMLADVEALSDTMGILSNGVMLFVGTPAECCERYDAPDLEAAFLRAVSQDSSVDANP